MDFEKIIWTPIFWAIVFFSAFTIVLYHIYRADGWKATLYIFLYVTIGIWLLGGLIAGDDISVHRFILIDVIYMSICFIVIAYNINQRKPYEAAYKAYIRQLPEDTKYQPEDPFAWRLLYGKHSKEKGWNVGKYERKISKRISIGVSIFVVVMVAAYLAQDLPKRNRYNAALRLMNEGQYQKAKEQLLELDEYQDAKAYTYCCMAVQDAQNGHYRSANYDIYMIREKYQLPVGKYPEGFQHVIDEVKIGYDQYIADSIKEEEETYREEVRTGIPFVGMYESDIHKTILGPASHSDQRNYEMIRGKRVAAYVYDWYKDGCIIFTARCYNGIVQQVWDYRTNPRQRAKRTTYSSTTKRSSSTTKKPDDPLDAKSYNNPEDFYDDNYYDFFDYEEAEDYYYEHGGE